MHEALELLRTYGGDVQQFGVVLAVASRNMGSSVPSIVRSLQTSLEDGSLEAGRVLAAYAAADETLKNTWPPGSKRSPRAVKKMPKLLMPRFIGSVTAKTRVRCGATPRIGQFIATENIEFVLR